ncbi:hypothetical protein FGB62_258g05 [Gracilaria domingensis]|nr:hypothetical protein FGB62_258g05 [Gracilaria domingensis]
MAVIPIKAQFVSLIITFILAVSELLALNVLSALNSFCQSRRLRRGNHVIVKSHQRQIRLNTLLLLLIFITLEIAVSNFSDPVQTPVLEQQDCFVVDRFDREKGRQDLGLKIDALEPQCAKVDNNSFTQMTGNVSIISDSINCSETPIFKVKFSWIGEPEFHNGSGRLLECENDICVLVFKQQQHVLISPAFDRIHLETVANPQKKTWFSRTELFYDTGPILENIARRAARVMAGERVADPYEFRRRIFSGSRKDTCLFEVRSVNETLIPNAVLVLLVSISVVSVVCYAICFGFRKRNFADFNDTMQWASRTFRLGDENGHVLKNPVVSCVKRGDGLLFKLVLCASEYVVERVAVTAKVSQSKVRRIQKP